MQPLIISLRFCFTYVIMMCSNYVLLHLGFVGPVAVVGPLFYLQSMFYSNRGNQQDSSATWDVFMQGGVWIRTSTILHYN